MIFVKTYQRTKEVPYVEMSRDNDQKRTKPPCMEMSRDIDGERLESPYMKMSRDNGLKGCVNKSRNAAPKSFSNYLSQK